MVRAIQITRTGGPEVLELVDVELPAPGSGEVHIRHTAIGVNFIDTYHRSGLYPLPSLPHGIGQEAAGVVVWVGPGVDSVRVGDRVAYAGGTPGSYCDERIVPARTLVPLPEGVADDVAAASLLKGMTVEYLVQRACPVQPGWTVLWHAAAGGVGQLACQWLSKMGVTVIGTVSTPEKAEIARENGCTHTILYGQEDFVAKVRALTGGEGVPVVFDSVGRSTMMGSLDCLRRRGMLVGFGNASGAPEPFDPLLLARKGSLFLTRPTLWDYTATRDELLASARAVFERLTRGDLRPAIGSRNELARAADVHRALAARETQGGQVLIPRGV